MWKHCKTILSKKFCFCNCVNFIFGRFKQKNFFCYIREAFPNLTVEDITIAHDTERLTAIDTERDRVQQAKLYCENYVKRREPLKIYPYPCGQVLGCCCKHVC